MTNNKLQGEITLQQLRTLVDGSNQANLLWGGLKKHHISTWEELQEFRKALKAEVVRLLGKAFPENADDIKVVATMFGVSTYTNKNTNYKQTKLATVVGNFLTAHFNYLTVCSNGSHLERGRRTPTYARLCYISPVLIANGEWHKQKTKTEILKRY